MVQGLILMVCWIDFFIEVFFYNFVVLFLDGVSIKRKASASEGPAAKQQKTIYPAYFIPELAHVVAMCDEKLPFVSLSLEVSGFFYIFGSNLDCSESLRLITTHQAYKGSLRITLASFCLIVSWLRDRRGSTELSGDHFGSSRISEFELTLAQ